MESVNGKYDRECERLLSDQRASMVLLLIAGGKKGNGMSVCINAEKSAAQEAAKKVPIMLRKLADMIENVGHFEVSPGSQNSHRTWSDLAKGEREHGD